MVCVRVRVHMASASAVHSFMRARVCVYAPKKRYKAIYSPAIVKTSVISWILCVQQRIWYWNPTHTHAQHITAKKRLTLITRQNGIGEYVCLCIYMHDNSNQHHKYICLYVHSTREFIHRTIFRNGIRFAYRIRNLSKEIIMKIMRIWTGIRLAWSTAHNGWWMHKYTVRSWESTMTAITKFMRIIFRFFSLSKMRSLIPLYWQFIGNQNRTEMNEVKNFLFYFFCSIWILSSK